MDSFNSILLSSIPLYFFKIQIVERKPIFVSKSLQDNPAMPIILLLFFRVIISAF